MGMTDYEWNAFVDEIINECKVLLYEEGVDWMKNGF
jgi:hypothetical protein